MICLCVHGDSFQSIKERLVASQDKFDLLEVRFDLSHPSLLEEAEEFVRWSRWPLLYTLRSKEHGGEYTGSQEQQMNILRKLALAKPALLDIELSLPSSLLQEIGRSCTILLSHHATTATSHSEIFQKMVRAENCLYKIAITANTTEDTLRFLNWAHEQKNPRLMAVAMGPHGTISRILSPLLQAPCTFAHANISGAVAPGQLSTSLLIDRYRYYTLNESTKVYGLIGSPVEQSISDRTHNMLYQALAQNAVYVKMDVPFDLLKPCLDLMKQHFFHGLSVTMPLKEVIVPLLDAIDPTAQAIGTVNTVVISNGTTAGYNTDGVGARRALERSIALQGKKVVIIGFGGAGKAIAYEARSASADVVIVRRSSNMDEIANSGYDILINATPHQMPVSEHHILPGSHVMDITTHPKETRLLAAARRLGCSVTYGCEMFVEQAALQFELWGEGPSEKIARLLNVYAPSILAGTCL